MSFAIEDIEERAINIPDNPISGHEVRRRVERIDKRLKVCCAGLIELSREAWACRNEPEEDGKTAPILDSFGNVSIKYLHRTAKDFSDTDTVYANIQQATAGTDSSIWSFLLKSLLLRLRTRGSP